MIPATQAARARQIEVTTRHLANEMLTGDYRSAFKGQGLDFEELRAYEPGDDLRSIDWNVTARTGRTHVRCYREERELSIVLAVDVSASADHGFGRQTKRDLAAEIAACLAYSALQQRDRVGLLLFTDEVERFMPPGRGRHHALKLIHEILSHVPSRRGTSLRAALSYLHRVQRRRSVVFLISDFTDQGFDRSLATLARRHDVIPVRVGDDQEELLPEVGRVLIEDAETGESSEVDTSKADVRRRYAQAMRERAARTRAVFRQAGCDAIELHAGHDYLEPLRAFLQQRLRRRVRP